MQEIIDQLRDQLALVKEERDNTPATKAEFGSPEETRNMVIQSLFAQAISHLETGIAQIQIINQNLY
jgi:hypothetical protein